MSLDTWASQEGYANTHPPACPQGRRRQKHYPKADKTQICPLDQPFYLIAKQVSLKTRWKSRAKFHVLGPLPTSLGSLLIHDVDNEVKFVKAEKSFRKIDVKGKSCSGGEKQARPSLLVSFIITGQAVPNMHLKNKPLLGLVDQ